MIRREMEDFARAVRAGDDPGRSFQNEVLDPYYGGGNPPSEPLPQIIAWIPLFEPSRKINDR